MRKKNSYFFKNRRQTPSLETAIQKEEGSNLHIDFFFFTFFEPYASKGACTVPKGYNFTLINRLYRARLIFLTQEITTEVSNYLVGLIVYLSIEDQTQDLYMFINCPGGWVLPGIAIFDAMQLVLPDIHTICMGIAASMGSLILVGGEITKRLAFPHAWLWRQ